MTQGKVFVDAHYWIALFSKKDQWHDMAVAANEWVENTSLVTSEMVLTEVLDAFADKGEHFRNLISEVVDEVIGDEHTEVVPQSSEMFNSSFTFYKQRPDKAWQLTDCSSILIMQEKGLQKVLTGDHHFEQAGFSALLKA